MEAIRRKRFDKITPLTDDTLVMGIPYSEFKKILEEGYQKHFAEFEEKFKKLREQREQNVET